MKALAERFEAFVERVTESGCWLWTGGTAGQYHYGVIRVGSLVDGSRAQRYAHRVSWELFHGPIPQGLHVLHRCDVHSCVNPAHLFLGTAAENIADMVSKGRQARGSVHGIAKLSEASVLVIRQSREPLAALASRLGVSCSAISLVRRRETWRHVA